MVRRKNSWRNLNYCSDKNDTFNRKTTNEWLFRIQKLLEDNQLESLDETNMTQPKSIHIVTAGRSEMIRDKTEQSNLKYIFNAFRKNYYWDPLSAAYHIKIDRNETTITYKLKKRMMKKKGDKELPKHIRPTNQNRTFRITRNLFTKQNQW